MLKWPWYTLLTDKSFVCILSTKQNNNVHIGNHLYFENQRKQGEETQQWYFKTVCQPGNSHHNSLQKTLMIVRYFLQYFCILLRIWKETNKKKTCWLFHWPLRFQTATFNIPHLTFSSQHGRVENNALCSTLWRLPRRDWVRYFMLDHECGDELRWSRPRRECKMKNCWKTYVEKICESHLCRSYDLIDDMPAWLKKQI